MQATKQLIVVLAARESADYRNVEGFKQILPYLTANTFREFPINVWRTTLNGVMHAYNNSPSAPVLHLINVDKDFASIKEAGLEPYDFPTAPNNMWVDKSGNPIDTARRATKQLIVALAAVRGLDYRTVEGFKNLLTRFHRSLLQKLSYKCMGHNPRWIVLKLQ